jgi:2,3-bisphosphoglycerate-independent phosphoglycerate mutase
MNLDFIKKLKKSNDSKIVMIVMDGIGGLPIESGGLTELETAKTPVLDKLAKHGVCGLHIPVGSGITPGSGPGHLGIFGYDPSKYNVGRGVLAAMGIGFNLLPGDVAARGNFCTIDDSGKILDRRAGRISTEKNKELCNLLGKKINIPGVEVIIKTVKEHRLLIVFRANELSDDLIDTDPQEIGKRPLEPKAISEKAKKTEEIVKQFIDQAKEILADQHPANMLLTRGYSQKPSWPSFSEVFGLKSAAVAAYPMYRGLAWLLGMEMLDSGKTIEDEFSAVEKNWDRYDFFFLHIKPTDSSGEDGDFNRKVKVIEKVDKLIPKIIKLEPDVIIVTGDHSTPALLKAHSWHPVPVLIWSEVCRTDEVKKFGERECIKGGLGPRLPAIEILPIALANAQRLEKYGA